MSSLITLCNQALAEVYKGSIANLDEKSPEARECKRFAPSLLLEMAEWSDRFQWNRKRVDLAATTNDRADEWKYAYKAPSDLATPIKVRDPEYKPEHFPRFGPANFPQQNDIAMPYLHEGGKIYTNIENAILVYSSTEMDVSKLSALGQRAFQLELAHRIATPLTKDRALARDISQIAQVARLEWVADEENKAPIKEPRYVSEAEWARLGYEI